MPGPTRRLGAVPCSPNTGSAPHAFREEPATGCRIWLRGCDSPGHPEAHYRGRKVSPARHAYERAVGPIPPDHILRQGCGEPPCVHHDHQEPMGRPALAAAATPAPTGSGFDGRPLRAARVAAGMSQAALAGRTGEDPSTVIRLEQGRGRPNLATLVKLAGCWGCRSHGWSPAAGEAGRVFSPAYAPAGSQRSTPSLAVRPPPIELTACRLP